ncbi:MAG: hypothetical protein JO033_02040 [Acidobacteriaceae bacterium]|nr:hypothetical protein [Acidobacteriaceae bacterium]MBV9502835.1 hypothetical protein [Acidobacteriaceae bacterium]
MELLRFYAHTLMEIVEDLRLLQGELIQGELGTRNIFRGVYGAPMRLRNATDASTLLEKTLQECNRVLLVQSAKQCKLVIERLNDKQLKSFEVDALVQAIEHELESRVFLSVPPERVDQFAKPTNGWAEIIAAFPDAQEDVEEMNKGFALSRYTAAVFHSLLVVEHGLIALGKRIGITDPKAGWDATYKRMSWLVNNRASVPADLDFNFIEQTKARMDSMKLAWRNKINHAAGRLIVEKTGFSDVSAEEVIVACRSFMRFLAENLP